MQKPRAVAIICEYNPYHAGHAHQLAAARRDTGASVVIAVMSEHATQRGELAIADGYVRAEAAARCGADIVVGLPFPYSCASAEFFASAGVTIASALGADALHFGSECGDIDALRRTAARLSSPLFIEQLTAFQSAHPALGIMECREQVYRACYEEALPCGSNDLLGLAYLTAIERQGLSMTALTCQRRGQSYNDASAPDASRYPSASALRALWTKASVESLRRHLPSPALAVLEDAVARGTAPILDERIGNALIAHFRTACPAALAQCAELEGGLAARLIEAARNATDLTSLHEAAATRRYTNARIRRALLYGLCDGRESDVRTPPAYVRLLAATRAGCAYLAAIRKSCTLPILTKPSDLPSGEAAARQRAIEQRFEAYLTLAYPTPQPAAYLLRQHPWVEK